MTDASVLYVAVRPEPPRATSTGDADMSRVRREGDVRFKILDDARVHQMVTQVYPTNDYAACGVEFRTFIRGTVVRGDQRTEEPLTCLICMAHANR